MAIDHAITATIGNTTATVIVSHKPANFIKPTDHHCALTVGHSATILPTKPPTYLSDLSYGAPMVTVPPHARMVIGLLIIIVSLLELGLIHRLGSSEAPTPVMIA